MIKKPASLAIRLLRPALYLVALQVTAASLVETEVKTLSFNLDSREPLKLPDVNFSAVKISPNGDLVFLAPDHWGIHLLSRASGALSSFSLHGVPESSHASVQIKDDVAVDDQGRLYLPANWFEWRQGSIPKAGVFLFGPTGRYLATIELAIQCSPERVVVDSGGNLVVLALEAAYAKGLQKECLLLHKFTRKGERLASFSPCPVVGQAATPGPDELRSRLARLRAETERGQLWIQNGLVYHVLPSSRLLRVFDSEGKELREVSFLPPDSGSLLAAGGMTANPANDRVWRILAMADGRFIVEWLHAEKAGDGGQLRTTFLALHSQDGRPLTAAEHPPMRPSIPLYCDNQGRVFFLFLNRASPQRMEVQLIQTTPRLQ
jgi:hypothetical protein